MAQVIAKMKILLIKQLFEQQKRFLKIKGMSGKIGHDYIVMRS